MIKADIIKRIIEFNFPVNEYWLITGGAMVLYGLKDTTNFDKAEIRDGISVISLKGLLEMKKSLGREKDLKDIELIENALGEERF